MHEISIIRFKPDSYSDDPLPYMKWGVWGMALIANSKGPAGLV